MHPDPSSCSDPPVPASVQTNTTTAAAPSVKSASAGACSPQVLVINSGREEATNHREELPMGVHSGKTGGRRAAQDLRVARTYAVPINVHSNRHNDSKLDLNINNVNVTTTQQTSDHKP